MHFELPGTHPAFDQGDVNPDHWTVSPHSQKNPRASATCSVSQCKTSSQVRSVRAGIVAPCLYLAHSLALQGSAAGRRCASMAAATEPVVPKKPALKIKLKVKGKPVANGKTSATPSSESAGPADALLQRVANIAKQVASLGMPGEKLLELPISWEHIPPSPQPALDATALRPGQDTVEDLHRSTSKRRVSDDHTAALPEQKRQKASSGGSSQTAADAVAIPAPALAERCADLLEAELQRAETIEEGQVVEPSNVSLALPCEQQQAAAEHAVADQLPDMNASLTTGGRAKQALQVQPPDPAGHNSVVDSAKHQAVKSAAQSLDADRTQHGEQVQAVAQVATAEDSRQVEARSKQQLQAAKQEPERMPDRGRSSSPAGGQEQAKAGQDHAARRPSSPQKRSRSPLNRPGSPARRSISRSPRRGRRSRSPYRRDRSRDRSRTPYRSNHSRSPYRRDRSRSRDRSRDRRDRSYSPYRRRGYTRSRSRSRSRSRRERQDRRDRSRDRVDRPRSPAGRHEGSRELSRSGSDAHRHAARARSPKRGEYTRSQHGRQPCDRGSKDCDGAAAAQARDKPSNARSKPPLHDKPVAAAKTPVQENEGAIGAEAAEAAVAPAQKPFDVAVGRQDEMTQLASLLEQQKARQVVERDQQRLCKEGARLKRCYDQARKNNKTTPVAFVFLLKSGLYFMHAGLAMEVGGRAEQQKDKDGRHVRESAVKQIVQLYTQTFTLLETGMRVTAENIPKLVLYALQLVARKLMAAMAMRLEMLQHKHLKPIAKAFVVAHDSATRGAAGDHMQKQSPADSSISSETSQQPGATSSSKQGGNSTPATASKTAGRLWAPSVAEVLDAYKCCVSVGNARGVDYGVLADALMLKFLEQTQKVPEHDGEKKAQEKALPQALRVAVLFSTFGMDTGLSSPERLLHMATGAVNGVEALCKAAA